MVHTEYHINLKSLHKFTNKIINMSAVGMNKLAWGSCHLTVKHKRLRDLLPTGLWTNASAVREKWTDSILGTIMYKQTNGIQCNSRLTVVSGLGTYKHSLTMTPTVGTSREIRLLERNRIGNLFTPTDLDLRKISKTRHTQIQNELSLRTSS